MRCFIKFLLSIIEPGLVAFTGYGYGDAAATLFGDDECPLMAGQDSRPFADVIRADPFFDEIRRRKVTWNGIEFIGRKEVQRPLLGFGKGQETGFASFHVDGADVSNGVGR